MDLDNKTGWLWIVSLIGIVAIPPSLLFISEFMIIKDLILKNKIALVILFVLFLTIILYGLTKAVLKMSYSISQDENEKQLPIKKEINWTMYLPQIVLLVITFALGLYMPNYLINMIKLTVLGF